MCKQFCTFCTRCIQNLGQNYKCVRISTQKAQTVQQLTVRRRKPLIVTWQCYWLPRDTKTNPNRTNVNKWKGFWKSISALPSSIEKRNGSVVEQSTIRSALLNCTCVFASLLTHAFHELVSQERRNANLVLFLKRDKELDSFRIWSHLIQGLVRNLVLKLTMTGTVSVFGLKIRSKATQIGPMCKDALNLRPPRHLRLATHTNAQCLTIKGCWQSH